LQQNYIKYYFFVFSWKSIHSRFQNMFYFYCNLYNTRATAVLSWTTFCPVFTDFSASFLTTSWKMPKKHPKFFFIKKLFLVLSIIRSKLSLSKKLANSMILANDLACEAKNETFHTFFWKKIKKWVQTCSANWARFLKVWTL
jgi:hypothetical protein